MAAAQAPAPWRALFGAHLRSLGSSPVFTLANLHPATQADGAPSPALPCLPRARTCVFRGMWADPLPDRSGGHANPAPRNPTGVYASDLLVFTTDARSEKAGDMFDSAPAGDVEASGGATGGGGPVEAVFWIDRDPWTGTAIRTQWRVRGHAWVLGPGPAVDRAGAEGEEEEEKRDDGARRVREALLRRMRRLGEPGGEGERAWSFEREVTAHFGNLSPLMRGSFRGPPPGTPLAYHTAGGEGVGQVVEDVNDPAARANFRVVVIVPEEVDQVDLSDERKPRRWLYVYRGEKEGSKLPGGEMAGGWEKVEVWP
ncbi:hypothetical protein VTJ83DRAFT_4753 [Remersonia thermophila]|uniref:Pyridoxamine 5'-phosphate oxidase Alr4036 family FMN-binding domain-containing protein n=1 Tax=Remersonia thermophila TaxID=72144 RepID=A0ABR4DAV8_9PEZI